MKIQHTGVRAEQVKYVERRAITSRAHGNMREGDVFEENVYFSRGEYMLLMENNEIIFCRIRAPDVT